jgi:hypothetical protein
VVSTARLVVEDLARFPAAWGQVLRRPSTPATFDGEALTYWDGVVTAAFPGETGIGWFEVRRRPFRAHEAERHLRTPEALLCVAGEAVCAVAAPVAPDALGPGDFRAFRLGAGEGLVLAPGTWHAIPFPTGERAVFWVVFRKGTVEDDLQVLDVGRARGFDLAIAAGARADAA